MDVACPLCESIATRPLLASNAWAVAFFDAFPVSPGHALVVTRRHVASLFELSPDERAGVWALLEPTREAILAHHEPAGFNVGVNVGSAAGQTVAHVHVHVIPRYDGDVEDPRGGVRWVIPERADYWSHRR